MLERFRVGCHQYPGNIQAYFIKQSLTDISLLVLIQGFETMVRRLRQNKLKFSLDKRKVIVF